MGAVLLCAQAACEKTPSRQPEGSAGRAARRAEPCQHASSQTLALDTTAKATNLANGKSAVVTVQDRGPFVDGRVVDVTPKVADERDIRKRGVTPVIASPIAVPQADGTMMPTARCGAAPNQCELPLKLTLQRTFRKCLV